ncbi:MAG: phosphate/phosphite/phosphonate ABC transporter substrate-binding protein [Chloroflexota bacterium]|nr:phosphate/phosphite/phosphonate ABC transporter substrate-binding protein [Chloroflexota bacterium]
MKFKRILWILITLVVTSSVLLAACKPATPEVEEEVAVEEEAEAEEAEEEAAPEEAFKVGLVTDVGEVDDKSFNQSAWEGVQMATEELGAEVEYIETKDAKDYGANIALFAEDGYDVIVTVGFALGEATGIAAAEYPDIDFIGVDQFQVEAADNVAGLIFPEDKSGFMAGALAGLLTETNTVAAVLGTDLVPPVVAFKEGYESGVVYANPEAEVISTYHPGGMDVAFTDPEWGATTAKQAVDNGADVVFGAGGKTGNGALIEVAGNEGLYCIGVDTDQWGTVPEAHACLVSSAMKLITPGVFDLVSLSKEGSFPSGNYVGEFGLAPFHDFDDAISQDIKDQLAEIRTALLNDEIDTGYPPEEEEVVTLGTEENPIVWGVVPSGETERVVSGFEEVAALIYEETGLVIEPFVATEYAGVIEAMCSEPAKAHMASLATFAYILAADNGCAEAALVATRFGSAVYNGQIFVRADSGIESIEDLAGKTFCRSDPLSTSGWIIPSITMKAAGVDPDTDLTQIVDAGSHDASVAGVYNGDCDAGASYVDARGRIEEDYPDVMDVITVINISADIPNDGVQFVAGFDEDIQAQIVDALLAIAETEAGQAALDTAYQWGGLEAHDDTFYDAFRQVLDAAGVSPEDL